MSHPTADAQNGKQVSPPPYTPVGKDGPFEDNRTTRAARAIAKRLDPKNELGGGSEGLPLRFFDAAELALAAADSFCEPVAVEPDDAVVLGRIRAVVDAWVSPLMPRGEAAGQMLEVVRPYLRAGAGAADEDAVERMRKALHEADPLFNLDDSNTRYFDHINRLAKAALAALQQGGSQLAVGDSFNGPKSDGLNIGSFTRAEGGSHE